MIDEPADVLLALGVRTVGHQQLAVAQAHDGRRARRMQAAVEDPRAGGPGLLDQRVDIAHDAFQDFRRRGSAIGLVDAEQVLFHLRLLVLGAGGMPALSI